MTIVNFCYIWLYDLHCWFVSVNKLKFLGYASCRYRLVRSRTPGSHPGNWGSNPHESAARIYGILEELIASNTPRRVLRETQILILVTPARLRLGAPKNHWFDLYPVPKRSFWYGAPWDRKSKNRPARRFFGIIKDGKVYTLCTTLVGKSRNSYSICCLFCVATE